jgi:uncharacterized delta-60 repeat protein
MVLRAGTPRLEAQSAWSVQASPTQQDLWGACYGEYGFAAVGTNGTILTSKDGVSWTSRVSGVTVWLVGVTWGQWVLIPVTSQGTTAYVPSGGYVAVGDQGTIITSVDSVNWTVQATGGARLDGVAYGGGLYLAVGEGGAIATSADGTHWTTGSAGVTGWLRGVVYDSSSKRFIVTGEGGIILATTDGMKFSAITSGTTSDIEAVAVGGSPQQFLADGSAGYLADSGDAMTWTAGAPTGTTHFRGCAIIGNTGVAVGSAGAISTTNLGQIGWQPAVATTSADLNSVAFVNDATVASPFAVAVGLGGVILGWQIPTPTVLGFVGPPGVPIFGSTVELRVFAGGQEPLSFQWSFDGQAIPGANGAVLALPQVQVTQNGSYTLTITNALGSIQYSYYLDAIYKAVIPGLVDESFDPSAEPFGATYYGSPTAAAIQPDGKLIFAAPFGFGRLNPDGTPDNAFDANASASLDGDFITDIFVQPDGRIIAAGFVPNEPIAHPSYYFSVRLNADGTADASYSPHSVPQPPFGSPTQDAIPQVTLQGGDYLAADGAAVVRLAANGAIDPTFAAISPPGFSSAETISSLSFALDPQGRVVVGASGTTQAGAAKASLFRLNPDGTMDGSFAAATLPGMVFAGMQGTYAVQGQGPVNNGLYIQASGKVVYTILESAGPGSTGTVVVGRLNADGLPDPAYPGLALPPGSSSGSGWTVGAATMTADGSLWLYAYSPSSPLPVINGTYRNGVIRIDPNGNFDPTYALNVDLEPGSGEPGPVTGIIPAPNGQWYAWGNFAGFNGGFRVDLVRINPQVGAQFSRLANISARTAAGTGSQTLAVGFVTQGPGDKTMLLRGIGPSLAPFGVTGYLADPELSLFDGSGNLQLTNDNWGMSRDGGAAIAAAAAQVGAFPLAGGSLDAAALATLSPGSHTFEVYGSGAGTGVALAEAYDTDTSQPSFSGPRAINFSCRSQTGAGAGTLIAGFVVEGGNSKRVLIRAVGPSLASFGVAGLLQDPVLTLYSGSVAIATAAPGSVSDSTVQATIGDVGAFGIAVGSQDAAMTLTLSPGAYTAQVTSKSGASGVSLVEVYEVP